MSNNEKKMSRFLSYIDKFSKKHEFNVMEKIKREEKSEIENMENKIVADFRIDINIEFSKIKSKFSSEISDVRIRNKRNIFKKRKEMIDDLFVLCEIKLREFTKTEEYVQYFQKKFKKIVSSFTDEAVIFVRKEDFDIKDSISLGYDKFKFFVDPSIKIGGFKASVNSFRIDETFDTKLSAQRKSFFQDFKLIFDIQDNKNG
ncbi:MAG: V-type ATP synthase subunit E [Candidatus Improbicoccus pseudotrichonymphae]|uniref:V-type ATP synthase subunit E n=1 Tax=Candidatus Improbicoccus pseudotrichonymphae TaxID=3033792 RepID=A0AA48I135_9FIRM|nr:MAG: V-type ATP synthase subunit E [Candidatus Improbicoccus pseudotrichonymphae]